MCKITWDSSSHFSDGELELHVSRLFFFSGQVLSVLQKCHLILPEEDSEIES